MTRDLYLELREIEERGRRLKLARRRESLEFLGLAGFAGDSLEPRPA
jgi:hypothetical protein